MKTKHLTVALTAIGGLITVAGLVVRFPPDRYGFYPLCPIYRYTGLQCPGCGATRALADLLNGRLALAINHNVLFVALVPLIVGYLGLCLYRAVGSHPFRWPVFPATLTYALLIAAIVFTVARNFAA